MTPEIDLNCDLAIDLKSDLENDPWNWPELWPCDWPDDLKDEEDGAGAEAQGKGQQEALGCVNANSLEERSVVHSLLNIFMFFHFKISSDVLLY